ncbi:MAG TPA: gamma-glutamyltransferase [Candidatus Baltobacteraceae bacterium]|nr:gamma-glutamyltransferase [Candidatus Baltobacteraceae bacterium]
MKCRVLTCVLAVLLALYCAPVATAKDAVATGQHAMIATEQHLATAAGIDVLRRGGNAVDAAVAVGYALAVVDPCCGNIGGGGFMVVRMHDGRSRFIDFREKAPLNATRTMYLDAKGNDVPERSRKGWLAIGVPGTVMGLNRALEEFGTMSRRDAMSAAIRLARDGYVLQPGDLIPFQGSESEGYSGAYSFAKQPNVRAIWMPQGRYPRAGDRIVQTNLANTLSLIATDGDTPFYRGPIARAIVEASDRNGGILTMDDFARYTVGESQPLQCGYHGYTIVSAPPPSSGGIALCEILNVVSPYPFARWGWHSPRETHYLIEAERRAYADRNADLGDPAFVKNPVSKLLDPSYAARLRAEISPTRATPSIDVKPGVVVAVHENDDTTHYSIVDKDGNAVAVTYTINDWFGSDVIAGDTGFFLNDEMDDFTSKPGVPNMFGLVQGVRNDIEPEKRPLSSMAPTIVLRNGKLAMVTGSPGGSRIITITLETILNTLDFGMNVQQAVDAPRIHMQWLPDEIQYEPNAFSTAAIRTLRGEGYAFDQIPSWGSAQAIVVDPKTGMLYGGTDRRHPSGAALGY